MLKQLLVISLFIFGLLMLLLFVFQRYLIYFPARQTPKLQDYSATDMRSVHLLTSDNLRLLAWYKPAQNQQTTILYLHGNAGHIGHRMPLARQFINAGFGVLLPEYRGFGGNPGSPTEQGLYLDSEAALQYLYQKGLKNRQIVVYGESLGTGVATRLAENRDFCGLILQSPFTSLASLAKYHYPWIFIKPRDRFDSLSRIKNIHIPLLILQGTDDRIVPYEEGLKLFNAARQPKNRIDFDKKNHNDLWDATNFSEKVIQFIRTACR